MDDRLSWEPAAFGNVTEVHFLAGDATDREQSEIWVPAARRFLVKELEKPRISSSSTPTWALKRA